MNSCSAFPVVPTEPCRLVPKNSSRSTFSSLRGPADVVSRRGLPAAAAAAAGPADALRSERMVNVFYVITDARGNYSAGGMTVGTN